MTENEAKDFLGRFSLDRIEYANVKEVDVERFNYFTEVLLTAMKALEEIQQYQAIGTVDDFSRLNYLKNRYEDETYDFCGEYGTDECELKSQLEILKEYAKIGTVEECREAKERQRGRKPIKDEYNHDCCPNCGWIVYKDEYGGRYLPHCENCGQAILWGEK